MFLKSEERETKSHVPRHFPLFERWVEVRGRKRRRKFEKYLCMNWKFVASASKM
jgi:hypothetical protein